MAKSAPIFKSHALPIPIGLSSAAFVHLHDAADVRHVAGIIARRVPLIVSRPHAAVAGPEREHDPAH